MGKPLHPASSFIFYQTDTEGYYASRKDLDPQVARHGYLRGWVLSDANGQYAIYTVRPVPYPNEDRPAHIHPAILEPNIGYPYYIDEFVFDADPLLTEQKRNANENRCGSGILQLTRQGDIQVPFMILF
jgi:protocatechuate 3,4-dioxygenase beta subunit